MKNKSCIIRRQHYSFHKTNIPRNLTESFITSLNIFFSQKSEVNKGKVFNFATYQQIVNRSGKSCNIKT